MSTFRVSLWPELSAGRTASRPSEPWLRDCHRRVPDPLHCPLLFTLCLVWGRGRGWWGLICVRCGHLDETSTVHLGGAGGGVGGGVEGKWRGDQREKLGKQNTIAS